ncbi:uncharacterized protein LOC108219832 isoform X2 [Daucus carota subsp. sativus]|uniref:uncharacterized protein LOC108219832 isoform X2 n=1 Tax=Daucus carota subsp. sativus TaxID=79200 RepID=UPI0007EFD0B3|nr:PREDICTED: uncharacterized protein LOC108219832 isoform X2 [Daucus carota subsp. sativus]
MCGIKEDSSDAVAPRKRLLCTTYFDALMFCYSPVHQMQQYYRAGQLDNCSGKWSGLVDCLTLKTKRSSEVEDLRYSGIKTQAACGGREKSNYFSILLTYRFRPTIYFR